MKYLKYLKYLKILYVQVLIAITIGGLLGHFYPEIGAALKPLGTGFINLVKMSIAPLIFCTVVTGIAGMQDMKAVGKTGGIAIIYFTTLTLFALFIGLVVVNIFQPGIGIPIPETYEAKDVAAVAGYVEKAKETGVVAFLTDMIPTTMFSAFTEGKLLQVLLVAIMFAFALNLSGAKGELMFDVVKSFSKILFKLIGIIMYVAPIGAFGAIAYTIGHFGITSVFSLGKLILCFYLTSILFVIVVLGAIGLACNFNILKFIRYIKDELFIVLGTSSSESVLPNMLKKMKKAGCANSVVNLVIPTGYSFNLDGTCIYLTMATMFLAQATETPMDLAAQLGMLLVLLISSKGAAAVTGGAFIVLAGTLQSVGDIPYESVSLILGIDRFMSEARALTNLVGNGVATIAVAKLTGNLDEEQLKRELNGDFVDEEDAETGTDALAEDVDLETESETSLA